MKKEIVGMHKKRSWDKCKRPLGCIKVEGRKNERDGLD